MPQQQIMNTETPEHGKSGSEPSHSSGGSSNPALAGTQQRCRHQSVYHEAANTATKNMTQDAHLQIVPKQEAARI